MRVGESDVPRAARTTKYHSVTSAQTRPGPTRTGQTLGSPRPSGPAGFRAVICPTQLDRLYSPVCEELVQHPDRDGGAINTRDDKWVYDGGKGHR